MKRGFWQQLWDTRLKRKSTNGSLILWVSIGDRKRKFSSEVTLKQLGLDVERWNDYDSYRRKRLIQAWAISAVELRCGYKLKKAK